jgi:OOP family OmpA-OmpF porin
MNKSFKFIILAALLAFLAGCAGTQGGHYADSRLGCAMLGAVAGGGVGAIDDSDAAVTGALIGAGIGAIFCGGKDTDGDGVPDSRDRCPGTPPGSQVDEFGCELDDDGDGVPNSEDRCPNTPAGVKVDAFGCELDDDGDGVPNSKDRCPNTPAGAKVDANGCELDSDGDGVVDSKDRCPNTPAGTAVDNYGCPLTDAYTLHGINFEFDSAKITSDSKATLDDALQILNRHPNLMVEIAGHTDSIGSAEYNQGLSERRARAVMDHFVANGISASRLTYRGYGETMPIADNGTPEGRAQNRRVEFRQKK